MDVSKAEATSGNSASTGNGMSKTSGEASAGTSRGAQDEQLRKRHQSGPSSCSSSPFEGDDVRMPLSKGRVSIVHEKDEDEENVDHFNGWKNSSKGDSKPRIVHASTDCTIQSYRVKERPPVPRIKVDKMDEESRYDGGKFGAKSSDRVEEKDELVPEEREILDELVQAINCDDFKRVMFIQNVVKEKNKEQWDVLFRNLPKNCQCVLLDYEKSLTKEDIRAIRNEVENELDDVENRFEFRPERNQRFEGAASPPHRVAFRPQTAPALSSGNFERRGRSPARFPELSEAERYFLSRRSVSPERRALSPERRDLSPEHRALSPERRALSPERRDLSPERRALSPERRALSPERRALSSLEDLRPTQDRKLSRLRDEAVDVAPVTRDRDFWRQKSHSLELQLRHISSEVSGLQEEVTRARQQASGWPARVAELESANAELQRELERRRRQERQLFDRASELEARLSGALQQERARERPRVDEAFVRRVLADYDAQGRELDQRRRQAAAQGDALAKAQSENQGLQRRLAVMQRSLDRLHAEKEAAILRTFTRGLSEERPYSSYSTNYLDFAEDTRPVQNSGFGASSDQQRTASAPARSEVGPEAELQQLERRYDHLQVEKRRLETELSHLPSSTGARNRRHVIVEENRIEERLDRVTKELGSLRLTLKQRHVLK